MEKAGDEGFYSDVEEDIGLLKQLVNAFDDAEQKLEEFYKKNDADSFNQAKRFMLDLNDKISRIIQ